MVATNTALSGAEEKNKNTGKPTSISKQEANVKH